MWSSVHLHLYCFWSLHVLLPDFVLLFEAEVNVTRKAMMTTLPIILGQRTGLCTWKLILLFPFYPGHPCISSPAEDFILEELVISGKPCLHYWILHLELEKPVCWKYCHASDLHINPSGPITVIGRNGLSNKNTVLWYLKVPTDGLRHQHYFSPDAFKDI